MLFRSSQAINKNREFVLLNSNIKINQKEYLNLQKLVYERKKGKPISYLTGQKFFWKYNFKINDHVLIPRPDTEVVVETILNVYKEKNRMVLKSYSKRALNRVWKAIRFSWWMTTTFHKFPDQSSFDQRIQDSEIEYLENSVASQRVLAENYVGLPY